MAIRGAAEEEKYAVIDISKGRASKILEEVEMKRALFEVYEGAVVSSYAFCSKAKPYALL